MQDMKTAASEFLTHKRVAVTGVSRNTISRSLIVTWYAPMCCVMPPASRSATRVSRIASSRLVLP